MSESAYVIRQGSVFWNGHVIDGVDLNSFVALNHQWAMDSSGVFSGNRRMRKVDRDSFEVLNEIFARDRNFVYYIMGIAKGVDAESFAVLDDGVFFESAGRLPCYRGYAKDKNGINFLDKMSGKPRTVRGADQESFARLKFEYARDCRRAYYYGWQIRGSDPGTFIVLNAGFTKDRKHVYYAGKIVDGADPATFEVVPAPKGHLHDVFGRDEHHVFHMNEILANADPSSFRVINHDYETDGTRHFKWGEPIGLLPADLEP